MVAAPPHTTRANDSIEATASNELPTPTRDGWEGRSLVWPTPRLCCSALSTAIDSLPKSIATLDKQRAALVKTLQALSTLGSTATRVITSAQKDLVANLQSLYPILTKLAEAGENLPKSLELMFTYPFPDAAARGVQGDYTNLGITLDVNTQKLLKGLIGLDLPTVGPTALPTGNISLPVHLPTKPGTKPTVKPTGIATTCVTVLLLPVCGPKLNRAGFDPDLARALMPGVVK